MKCAWLSTGRLGSASVHLHASGGVGFTEVVDESYSDSNGGTRRAAGGRISGPAALVQLAIHYMTVFAAGDNLFQLDLATLVTGEAFSDFSHTAKIAGITLLSDDVQLLLPAGFFTQYGSRHWSLRGDGSGGDPDPVTVAEPGTAVLVLAAGLVGRWRRRRCHGGAALSARPRVSPDPAGRTRGSQSSYV